MKNLLWILCMVSPSLAHGAVPCQPGVVNRYDAVYDSLRTGYFPENSEMEGGFVDRKKQPLRTLQDYLKGKADYVSVAMDHTDQRLPYGTKIRIPAIEKVFNLCIEFRVVDTGGAFVGMGTKKIDICNDNRNDSYQ